MDLNDFEWRRITFEEISFPSTLMGASILESVLGITDREVADWIWRLPICCGVEKRAPADVCHRCAQQLFDLLVENRQRVLDGIRERLGTYGFDPERTYQDWLMAFQRIIALSATVKGECRWSAPSHPNDRLKSRADWQRLMDALEWERDRLT